jgi:hypothetical protein
MNRSYWCSVLGALLVGVSIFSVALGAMWIFGATFIAGFTLLIAGEWTREDV